MPEAVRKALAVKASQKCTGGLSMTKVIDNLCRDGHLVQLNVICPPIPSDKEIKEHENKLLLLMRQFHRDAHKLQYDIFTSRCEHDTWGVKNTHVYVSFPFYYAEVAEELAVKLSMCKTGTHHFAAWVSYDGKKKLGQKQAVVPWESTMSGTVIPSLTPEQIQDTLKPVTPAVYKAKLEADLKDCLDHAICKRDMCKEGDSMEEYLYPKEIEHVKGTMTYKLAVKFRNINAGTAQALFQIGGCI